jgi:ABC-type multidrug transport system fused ATPase/permease subunit
VIKEPVFLILDEPTAALDPASAAQLNHTLTALAAGRTTVRATHRLAEVQTADLILVLQNGEVVQRGAHDQLIAEPGWYRTVSTLQAAVGEAQPTARAAVASAFARARPS